MAVHAVSERFSGKGLGIESPDAKTFSQNATRVFDVLVNNLSDNEVVALTAPGIPQVRDPHPTNAYLRASSVHAQKTAPYRYEVQIGYAAPGSPGQSPLDQPLSIELDAIVSEEDFDVDANGTAMVTVTGEAFKPAIKVPVYDTVIRCSKNLPTVDPVFISTYRNTVNSDNWNGFPPGTVRITSFKAQSVSDADQPYWSVSAEFQVRRAAPGSTDAKAWYKRVLAQGYKSKFSTGSPLHIFGGALVRHDKTTGVWLRDTEDSQFYEFKIFRSLPFAPLGLS